MCSTQPSKSVAKASSSKRVSGSAYKKLKVEGGRPAVAKKVTPQLDSDDELIVRMKNAKYLEKDIAERLEKEGRIKYHPKTIGTRWARIKKVMQREQDQMLDEELTDWHDGDVSNQISFVRRFRPTVNRTMCCSRLSKRLTLMSPKPRKMPTRRSGAS